MCGRGIWSWWNFGALRPQIAERGWEIVEEEVADKPRWMREGNDRRMRFKLRRKEIVWVLVADGPFLWPGYWY